MEIIAPINRAKVGDVIIFILDGAIGFRDIITNGIHTGELAKLKLIVFFVLIPEIKNFKFSSEMVFVSCINFCEQKPPIKERKKANIPPQTNNKKIFFKSRLAAAANGPGVGGTRTWVANKPVESATAIVFFEFLVNSDIFLLNEDRIINAASQNTGMEIKKPIKLMIQVIGRNESFLIKPIEIISVAPLFSRQIPIITPKNINNPIFFETDMNPLKISNEILVAERFNSIPSNIHARKITNSGFNLSLELPIIIHIIVIKIKAIS